MSSEQNPNGSKLYGWIVAVGTLCLVVIGLVAAFIPDQTPMLAAIVTGFGLAIIAQLFNAQKLTKIEEKAVETAGATAANAEKLDATDGRVVKMGQQLDGRLEELLRVTKEAYFAKGQVLEKEKAVVVAAALIAETAKPAEPPAMPATIVTVEEMHVEADQVSVDQKEKKSG